MGTNLVSYLKHIACIAIDHESRPPILGIALESGDGNAACTKRIFPSAFLCLFRACKLSWQNDHFCRNGFLNTKRRFRTGVVIRLPRQVEITMWCLGVVVLREEIGTLF